MVRPTISEFSFGYALTESIVSKKSVTAAPVFPSLRDEGSKGYDIMLQFPALLFLQFKLSDYMKGPRAQESKDNLISRPFYRMHLRPGKVSSQHSLLLELEKKHPRRVYYAAPLFHKEEEFNDCYLNGTMLSRTNFIRPSRIGPFPDGEPHHVAFNEKGGLLVRCSEPELLDHSGETFDEVLDHLRRSRRQNPRRLTQDLVRKVNETLWNVVSDHRGDLPIYEEDESQVARWRTRAAELHPVAELGFLARTYFDVQPIFVSVDGESD